MKCVVTVAASIVLLILAACESGEQQGRAVGELASERIEISAETSEPIVEIFVPEGARVAAGQAVMRQDSSRAEASLAAADAQVAEARARLAELVRGPRSARISAARANLAGAESELEFRAADLTRIRSIESRGLASAEALDSAVAAFDTAQASLEFRRAELEDLLAGTTVEELEQAESALQRAEAVRAGRAIDLERHTLRAPTDGVLDSRPFEIGERPAPGQVVAVLLSGEQPYARVYVPEHLRVHVAPGTRARIHVDGLDRPLDGRVRWIASEAAFTPYYALTERDRGRLTYLAKVDIDEERERLPDGVPVEVEFTNDNSKDDAER